MLDTIIIKKIMLDKRIILIVEDKKNSKIVKYSFYSKESGSCIGARIVLVTLLRYGIMMTLNVEKIYVDFEVDEYEAEYLNSEIDNLIHYSWYNHKLLIKRPTIVFKQVNKSNSYDILRLDKRKNFIGYSGGKDSQLCLELIESMFSEVIKFKIDFETEPYKHDFNERIDIINENTYYKISTQKLYELHGKNYYQEEDLHCCFAIPYYGVTDGFPQSLTIGLQFDVVNYYLYDEEGNQIQEYDLMETYDSIKKFENLMHHYGLKEFRVIVPLASLTSFSIYNILRKKHGDEKLRSFNSCWTPTKEGKPCGKCLKCQRVAYIYDILDMKLNELENYSLELIKNNEVDLDFLFGSITCKQLLEKRYKFESVLLKDLLFVDEKINDLDWGLSKEIEKKYLLKRVNNPFKEAPNV